MKNGWKYAVVVLTAAIAVLLAAIVTKNCDRAPVSPGESSSIKETSSEETMESTDETSEEPSSESAETEEESTEESVTAEPTEPQTERSTEVVQPTPHYEDTLNDVAFIGDSRTVFMGSAEIGGVKGSMIVPDSAIFATYGGQLISQETFRDAEQAGAAGRKKAVFWYGVNDVQLNPQRDDQVLFVANFRAVVNTFRAKNPNAEIYILSVVDTAKEEKDYYEGQSENIRNYNVALEAYAEAEGYHFVNVKVLIDSMEEDAIFRADHIHFTDAFYHELAPFLSDALEVVF